LVWAMAFGFGWGRLGTGNDNGNDKYNDNGKYNGNDKYNDNGKYNGNDKYNDNGKYNGNDKYNDKYNGNDKYNDNGKYRDLSTAQQTIRLSVAPVEMTWHCVEDVALGGEDVAWFVTWRLGLRVGWIGDLCFLGA
jgi:hypothetical protein